MNAMIRSDCRYQTEWRRQYACRIAREMDMKGFGVEAVYLFGSVEACAAGLGSDIDLIIHLEEYSQPGKELITWFREWEERLLLIAREYTDEKLPYILDLHFVNQHDIETCSSYAVKMKSLYEPPELLREN